MAKNAAELDAVIEVDGVGEEDSELKVKEPTEESIKPSKKEKDPWAKISAFKDSLEGLRTEELREKLGQIRVEEASNDSAQKADPDLKRARQQVGVCSEVYVKERAELRLKAKLLITMLSDGGDATAERAVENAVAAKELSSFSG